MRLPIIDDSHAPSSAPVELPPLHETTLDWDGVDCLLADIDDLTEVIDMRARTVEGHAVPQSDLVEARDGLRRGALAALQITYAFADQTWSDTLLVGTEGIRLLRMVNPMRAD